MQPKKKFITFPYPYMNGTLHLGHGYTLLCADIQARYYEMKGYDILFPFGFHGSGMPIVACSIKLKRELEQYKDIDYTLIPKEPTTQIQILLDMQVDPTDLVKFIEPEFWIQYFSQRAIQDLNTFDTLIDFSRSFYTTKLNPHYDSFITWQFNLLIKDGLVKKGKRNTIYSILDKQSCADHDRRIGEGCKPIKINCKLIDTKFGSLIITIHNKQESEIQLNPEISNNIFINKVDEFVSFDLTENNENIRTFICSKFCYLNLSNQIDISLLKNYRPFIGNLVNDDIIGDNDFKFEYFAAKNHFGSGFYAADQKSQIDRKTLSCVEYKNGISYFEPDGYVESRTNDRCIVANVDQWFIDYGNVDLKENVVNYIQNNMDIKNSSLFNSLINSSKDLDMWPCSRNFGLGTYIPGTIDLIDSLSDSTIYMAYYTIAHLIEDMPNEYINHPNDAQCCRFLDSGNSTCQACNFWSHIFFGTQFRCIDDSHIEKIKIMREQFLFWYPMDIRVSGKDLIPNHLTMALYNHYAIWKDIKYMPQSYITNGYLMLNGKKMSKSEGNFKTLRQSIDEYGSDAVRFTLAYNYSFDDGNFVENYAKSISTKFNDDWIHSHFTNLLHQSVKDNNSKETESTIWDKVFNEDIDNILYTIDDLYKQSKYKIIIDNFDYLILCKNNYVKMQELRSEKLIKKYVDCCIILLYPIVPKLILKIKSTFEQYNYKIIFPDINQEIKPSKKYGYYRDLLISISEQCFKLIKKKEKTSWKCQIHVYSNFSPEEQEIITNPELMNKESGTTLGKYKSFYKYVITRNLKYGNLDNNDEYNMISQYLKFLYNCPYEVIHGVKTDGDKFKYFPGYPKIILCKEE
jgi:leucyl-tRNA synthetase